MAYQALGTFSFQDSLTIHNNKFLKWLDTTGTSRSNVICLDQNNNVNFGSSIGDVYINSLTTQGNFTYINVSSGGVIVPQKLGIGFTNNNFLNTFALGTNKYIGLNTNNGFLGLAAGNDITTGSRIELFNNTTGGHMNINSGIGVINLNTNNAQRMAIGSSGTITFTPNGSSIVTEISNDKFQINSLVEAKNGLSVTGDIQMTGTLSINSVTGNINFDNSAPSLSSTTGAIFITGGLGINNTTDAASVTSGGGITCSGGIAISKRSFFGGNTTFLDSTFSTSSISGSVVLYGGLGLNSNMMVRSSSTPQIRIAPAVNNNESTVSFESQSNFSGLRWSVGHIGSGVFGITQNGSAGITLTTNGNVSVLCTANSSGIGSGGSLTVQGGASFAKDVFFGGPMLVVPTGDNTRPQTSQPGAIRFNTTTNQFEGYTNSTWGSIGGGTSSDVAGTTYVAAEMSPGANDGNLRFVTKNVERMRINSAGNIGIGTSSPSATLDVLGNATIALGITAGNSYIEGTLDVLNNSTFYGSITNASDIRLKKNIVPLTSVLDKVDNLRTVLFNYTYSNTDTEHLGFIAQDFVDTFPQLVKQTMDGYYTLDYLKVTVLLMKCIQELKSMIPCSSSSSSTCSI